MTEQEQQIQFLRALFGGKRYDPALTVEIRRIRPDYDRREPRHPLRTWYGQGVGEGERLIADAALWRDTWDVYMGVLPRVRGGADSGSTRGCGVLWVDIDAGAQTFGDARTRLVEGVRRLSIPAPNMMVRSGGGIHAYWLLSDVVPSQSSDDHKLIRSVLQRFVSAIGGKEPDAHACPSAVDVARILRLPGTYNRKIDGNPRPTVLLRCEPQEDRKPFVWWRGHLPAIPLPYKPRPNRPRVYPAGSIPPGTVNKMTAGVQNGKKHFAMVEVAVSCRKEGWEADAIYNAIESCGTASGVDMSDPEQIRHAEAIVDWVMGSVNPNP